MNISIITVNLNNLEGLKRTLDSVIKQSFSTEYIVVDGGSTDGSVKLLEESSDRISYWVSEKDSGIYNAMNKGIRHAKGKYCMFLNSGDELYDEDTINLCMDAITRYPTADIIYGDIYMFNSSIETQNKAVKKMPSELSILFFKNNTLNHQASLIKTSLFGELGFYPEQYRLASDYWLYLTSLIRSKSFVYLDTPLVKYDLGGVSATSFSNYQDEMKQIWESTVPDIVLDISKQNDMLIAENKKLTSVTQYGLVRLAIKLNEYYQRLKF
ncbi:glycosyltransferase family 2 protein [Hymenobacter arizonensis]|uniref:Glycosyl transferase family 2 n=1 Tax=Hymenobacter arizonensis TaxID=1227077 RepID=A0A1I5YR08_HYMAR|nr:glycosyltransferase family 2 protein [Hymenobacter arizonensis]SFQ46661.1 Glycosyl transferase family 2 [Hymenobacter arizonensis]